MEAPRPSAGSRIRGASLIALSAAIYLGALFATLYTIDTAYYDPAKWDIVQKQLNDGKYLGTVQLNELRAICNQYFSVVDASSRNDPRATRYLPAIKERMKQFADTESCVTRIVLELADGTQIHSVENPERFSTENNLSNSLFSRKWERSFRASVTGSDNRTLIGLLRIYITTKRGVPEIEALTGRYWLAVWAVAVGYTGLFFAFMRLIILPLGRVLNFMEGRSEFGAPIIPTAKSPLERAYNNLARDATLTRFSKDLRERISSGPLGGSNPVAEHVPPLVRRYTGVSRAQLWQFRRRDGKWEVAARHLLAGEADLPDAFEEHLLRLIAENEPALRPHMWAGRVLPWQPAGEPMRSFYCDAIDQTADEFTLFAVQSMPFAPPPNRWTTEFYGRLAQEIRYALRSLEHQRRMILQEKSKANISLSRNLGHDLTNVIATSKLELMTVKTLLSMSPEDVKASPKKEQIFREALTALLDNTRIMQEIVNLYRSFSYLQKPKFEETDVNELVSSVADLYRLCLSRSFKVETRLAEGMPKATIEPRLMRLALFNLMTNATDAMKRGAAPGTGEPTVAVRTAFDAAAGRVEIIVEDNGPGIRDAQGNPLAPDKIQEIFRLGYTTKENQEGEGLGLNWVQTIVREFHAGDIIAANRPAGGASFALRLPTARAAETPSAAPDSKFIAGG